VQLENEEINSETPPDTFYILSRAQQFVAEGDFYNAVRILCLLRGEPARVASSWISDMRAHLETKQVASMLLAHAAAMSVRSVY